MRKRTRICEGQPGYLLTKEPRHLLRMEEEAVTGGHIPSLCQVPRAVWTRETLTDYINLKPHKL